MGDWTNYVVRHFISGSALFSGMALCLLGCSLKAFCRSSRIRACARIAVLAGIIVVVLSAAPFPLWVYGMFIGLVALAAFRPLNKLWQSKGVDHLLLLVLLVQSLVMAYTEILHSRSPKVRHVAGATLFVLGDSISIGADPPGKNWPDLLGELTGLRVRNLAFGGARVETALGNASLVSQENALVILEIGGNDLLGSASIPKFREDLEKMLALVCRSNRPVAMIELPLPPLYNRYGMVQRSLAKAHGVALIPKRYLANVITTPGATVDGLHLSNAGHIMLAQSLSKILTAGGTNSPAHNSDQAVRPLSKK